MQPRTRNDQATRAWPLHDGEPPFIRLTAGVDGAAVSGDHHCELGTVVPGSQGGPEQGVYARWHWDGTRLSAQVDPLGFYSLFVYRKGETIAVSPSLLQLVALGADTTPDHRALAVFHRLGLFINDDTPFAHIRTLPAGGRLTWWDGRSEVTGGPLCPPVRRISRGSAVDGLIALTRDSVRSSVAAWPGDLLLPLSGGRDSRHILLELDHLGRPPAACLTFQHRAAGMNAEVRAARAICESVGVRHHVLGRPRSRSRDSLRALVLTGLCSDEHAQMMPLHDYLRGRPEVALDGIGGDILTNPDDHAAAHYARAQAGDFIGIARAMMDGHATVITRPGRRGPGTIYSPELEAEATEYLAQTVESFASAADPYQAFWFWNRTRREIGFVASALFASGGGVFCPFLDRNFVDFCLSLPFEVTLDQQLHNDAMTRAYPRHSRVPFAEGFADLPGNGGNVTVRLSKAVQGIDTVVSLRPDHPVREVLGYLRGSQDLYRRPGEVLQLHALALSGLDAGRARHLLALEKAYRDAAPADMVSDTFDPGQRDGR